MARIFYPLLLWLARPFVHVRLRWRARREPAYGERRRERFGHLPDTIPSGVIWLHTVSAGETIAAVPLVQQLTAQFPKLQFLVTTMTPTGSQQVQERLGDKVAHCYAPYDFPDAIQRFFDAVQPRVLVLMETELWPNMIRTAQSRNVPVLLVNGRLSAKSARGYQRIASLSRPMLAALDAIACQTMAHRDRFIALGTPAPRVTVAGSVKFDVRLPRYFEEECARLKTLLGIRDDEFIWIAASTHPGEEAIVLDAFERLLSQGRQLRLILVPRHPARADEVAAIVGELGLTCERQSACPEADTSRAQVILGDVMGTLLQLYGVAHVAFVGGSLVPIGGHNPIEPALYRLPIICGPHQFNFADVMTSMADQGGLETVSDATGLADAVAACTDDGSLRQEAGAAAHAIVEQNRGATARVVELVSQYLQPLNGTADSA